MKKNFLLLTLILTLTSCISFYDLQGVDNFLSPTVQETNDNKVSGVKRSEACVTNVLYIVSAGDSSIETAARKGNITKILNVSTKYKHLIFFYIPWFQEGCTIVTGQ
jgi:hypothetical protein